MFQTVKERRAERRAKLDWAIPRRECFKARAKEQVAQKKLCTATRERLSLDCSAKLVINIVAVNYSSHYFNFEEVKVDFEEVEVDFEEVGRISRKS